MIGRIPRPNSKSIDDLVLQRDRNVREDNSSLESEPHSHGCNSGCGSVDGISEDEDLNPSSTNLVIDSVNSMKDREGNITNISQPDLNDIGQNLATARNSSDILYDFFLPDRSNNAQVTSTNDILKPLEQSPEERASERFLEKNEGTFPPSTNANIITPFPNIKAVAKDHFVIEPSSSLQSMGRENIHGVTNKSSSPVNSRNFTQSSHSLALERAGSRQPLCVPEELTQQNLVLSNDDESMLLLSTNPYSMSTLPSSSLADNDFVFPNNNSNRLGTQSQVPNIREINGILPNHHPSMPTNNTNPLFPHLTTTTRINVNISTAAVMPLIPSSLSPSTSLERRGSTPSLPRIPVRNALDSSPPLLPARTSNQEGPILPPRPNLTGPDSKSLLENGNSVDGPTIDAANSVWYVKFQS